MLASTAAAGAAADAAAGAPEGAAAANGDASLAHQPQSAAGDPADPQVKSAANGGLHQTETTSGQYKR